MRKDKRRIKACKHQQYRQNIRQPFIIVVAIVQSSFDLSKGQHDKTHTLTEIGCHKRHETKARLGTSTKHKQDWATKGLKERLARKPLHSRSGKPNQQILLGCSWPEIRRRWLSDQTTLAEPYTLRSSTFAGWFATTSSMCPTSMHTCVRESSDLLLESSMSTSGLLMPAANKKTASVQMSVAQRDCSNSSCFVLTLDDLSRLHAAP